MTAVKSKIAEFFFAKFGSEDSHIQLYRSSTPLFKGAAGTFGIMVTGAGLSFATTVLLARILEPGDFGLYKYVMAWVALLSIPSSLGSDQLLVREVANFHSKKSWGHLRGILRWSTRAVFFASVAIGSIATAVSFIFAVKDAAMRYAVLTAMVFLPVSNLVALRQSAIRGLNHVIYSKLLENILTPTMFLVSVLLLYFFFTPLLSPAGLIAMRVSVYSIALVIVCILLRSFLPATTFQSAPAYQTKRWRGSVISFTLTSGINTINKRADVIMVGVLMGMDATGIYAVASYGAEIMMFIIMAVNTVLSPIAARLFITGQHRQLQQITTISARVVFMLSFFLCGLLILFGRNFLLIFGPEFTRGIEAFVILAVGKMIHVSMGLSGMLLNMTGFERETAIGSALGVVLNVSLNAILIPVWGLQGAAVSTVIGGIATVILLNVRCADQLGIKSSVFYVFKVRPKP